MKKHKEYKQFPMFFKLFNVLSVALLINIVTLANVQQVFDNGHLREHKVTPSVEELILQQRYPLEVHTTRTKDGYVLKMHRIPHSKRSPQRRNKPAVLLMHGLMLSSADWIIMGADKGLGYILADAGYDVWMGNARGNVHSREHEIYKSNTPEYWQFSWHEMGVYDLPAMIDHILGVTGEKGVHYIGYSQGCTIFFVMGAERPEYNSKIRSMQALGPAAFLSNATNPVLRVSLSMMDTFEWAAGWLGMYEFMPSWAMNFISTMGKTFCADQSLTQDLCLQMFFSSGAFTSKQLNSTMLPKILSYMPAGASVRQLLHFGQAIKTGTFRQFDYGQQQNLIEYGQSQPPDYDLGKITAPVALHWSHNDDFTMLTDVQILGDKLSNLIGYFEVPDPSFTHFDFLWANQVNDLVYKTIIEIIRQY